MLLFVSTLGCASWDLPTSQAELKLPLPDAGADAIVFETAFVRWPSEPAEDAENLWESLDEQFLPPDLRQTLAANGLRAGILSDPLPEAIRRSLEATRDPLAVITDQQVTAGAELLARRERRQCPSGSVEEIEVLPVSEGRRVVLLNDAGRVRGIVFDQPRGFLELSIQSLGDGRVRIELLPIVDYGEPRKRFIGGQNVYRIDVRRDREPFENLTVSSTLTPGQTLVLTATPERKGLGAAFFADRFQSDQDRLALLLRIAEARRDELFSKP
jgi:hypothetical protein